MVLTLEEIGQICRFCLGRGNLMALSEAASGAFAIEDAKHYTGVELSEKEGVPYSICTECCQTITSWINFRRACSRNNIIFKKLVAVLSVRGGSNAARQETGEAADSTVLQGDSQHDTGETRAKEEARSDTPIITLDDSDPDDLQADLNTGNGNDSDTNDSTPSLYSEMLQETPYENFVTKFSGFSRSHLTEDLEVSQSMSVVSEVEEKETKRSTMKFNPKSLDDSDSNDSLPSLYEEAMAEAKRIRKRKDRTDPNAAANPKDKHKLCPLCGILTSSMKSHMQTRHIRDKQFICPHCSKACFTRSILNQHINTWHEKRIIVTCVQCGKGFTNHSSHFYHMANSHGKSDVYECETCHRKLKSLDGYKKHLKEHSLTCFSCPGCDKLFKSTVNLETHKRRYNHS